MPNFTVSGKLELPDGSPVVGSTIRFTPIPRVFPTDDATVVSKLEVVTDDSGTFTTPLICIAGVQWKCDSADRYFTSFTFNTPPAESELNLRSIVAVPATSPTKEYLRGPGISPGGTTGQSLVKASDNDYDTEWATPDSTTWDTLAGKPIFADVATSGSYSDLTDQPVIPDEPDLTPYAKTADVATKAQGELADTALQPGALADYAKTSDVPTTAADLNALSTQGEGTISGPLHVGNVTITSVTGGANIQGSAGGSFNVTDVVYTGSISVDGHISISDGETVDGRDVSADGETLDTIAAGYLKASDIVTLSDNGDGTYTIQLAN